ncbi:hypothetical protein [Geomobilimonas luticola]|uniref:Nucleotide modification associated domain-containing protein n=1 Tax=Geomobilimonas luticola TaxID=1114878 RepID=A0ABS5SDB7_9BACT|nr:hypothetical protein [Geomobilimonas luticola]MBT0653358.1 hypothetical protein [Geomobilimonas luticola]
MRLFSYIVTHDTGFAPNPFWGFCTLANCKPAIRRAANVGDWIVGISPKAKGNKLIYAMQVNEILTYEQYFNDERFSEKIPYYNSKVVHKRGDNIYRPLQNGNFQQLQSMHSNGDSENPTTKAHDLGGIKVLIAHNDNFYYHGSKALVLPTDLNVLKVGRAHKNRFSPEVITAFLNFISNQQSGVNAPPYSWPPNDNSWKRSWP